MKEVILYLIAGLKFWWGRVLCRHDYVVKDVVGLGTVRVCTKCEKVKYL